VLKRRTWRRSRRSSLSQGTLYKVQSGSSDIANGF